MYPISAPENSFKPDRNNLNGSDHWAQTLSIMRNGPGISDLSTEQRNDCYSISEFYIRKVVKRKPACANIISIHYTELGM